MTLDGGSTAQLSLLQEVKNIRKMFIGESGQNMTIAADHLFKELMRILIKVTKKVIKAIQIGINSQFTNFSSYQKLLPVVNRLMGVFMPRGELTKGLFRLGNYFYTESDLWLSMNHLIDEISSTCPDITSIKERLATISDYHVTPEAEVCVSLSEWQEEKNSKRWTLGKNWNRQHSETEKGWLRDLVRQQDQSRPEHISYYPVKIGEQAHEFLHFAFDPQMWVPCNGAHTSIVGSLVSEIWHSRPSLRSIYSHQFYDLQCDVSSVLAHFVQLDPWSNRHSIAWRESTAYGLLLVNFTQLPKNPSDYSEFIGNRGRQKTVVAWFARVAELVHLMRVAHPRLCNKKGEKSSHVLERSVQLMILDDAFRGRNSDEIICHRLYISFLNVMRPRFCGERTIEEVFYDLDGHLGPSTIIIEYLFGLCTKILATTG